MICSVSKAGMGFWTAEETVNCRIFLANQHNCFGKKCYSLLQLLSEASKLSVKQDQDRIITKYKKSTLMSAETASPDDFGNVSIEFCVVCRSIRSPAVFLSVRSSFLSFQMILRPTQRLLKVTLLSIIIFSCDPGLPIGYCQRLYAFRALLSSRLLNELFT